ncbi:MAG: M48 family metallopeptidase [Acidobacteriota bacterium]
MISGEGFCRIGVVWAMAVASSSLAWGQTEIKPGFNLFSVQQDIEIGRQSAAEVERQLPLLDDSVIQDYIGKIGERLAEVVQGGDYPYQFKVVNVSDVNAFALPGGFMYINRGLIEAADSEAELAGVMAHEIAHVAVRHGTNQASKAYLGQAGLGLLGGLLGGGSTGTIIGAVGGFGLNATFLKFSRSAEEQADLVGTQTLLKAGYPPMAMADFFQELRERSGRDPGKLEQFFSSHPAPANRSRRVREEIELLGPLHLAAPVGDFSALQSRMGQHPEAPSMSELAGGAKPDAGAGKPSGTDRPDMSRLEPPSDKLELFEPRDGSFRIRYPSNWQVVGSDQGMGVTIVPEGGSTQNNIVYGMVIGHFDPANRSSRSRRGSGPIPGRDQLERTCNKLIESLLESNNYLRPVKGSVAEEWVDGERALSTILSGPSPVTAELERVRVVTRSLPDRGLIYLLFVSPQQRFEELEKIMKPVLSSLSINDPVLLR